MDKKIAGLLGAVAGLATVGTQAAIPPVPAPEGLQTSSYADLLAPIPNAVEALQADNAARARNIELAQYYYNGPYGNPYNGPAYGYPNSGYYNYPNYHHHHHHNNYYAHHHHHHHNNSAFIGIPGVGGVVVPAR